MKKIITTLLLIIPFIINAQTIVKGVITDKKTEETIVGATISTQNDQGTTTDLNGNYSLELNNGTYTLTFSSMGYAEQTKEIVINGEEILVIDIILEEESEMLIITTVTGSRYEKNITKETVSMEVIRPEFIERNANTDLAQVIERVPGVQVVDGQANIRSGSGFAYGAGSRVAVVVDEQPLLSAELSDVKWNFIPIENASQIEIIKGASSVLYGSGGLNGVINVRTAYPTAEPYTKLTYYTGAYFIPNKNGRQWYNAGRDSVGIRPFFTGLYLAHRQKIKDNFELVLGSNIHYDRSFLKTADEQRYRFNFNTRYMLPKNDKISIGLNGNIMIHNKADFFLWADGFEQAYHHVDDPINGFRYYTITLDPYLTAYDKKENKHSVKLRYFTIKKILGGDDSPTGVYSGEYQFQKNFKNINMVMTTGVSSQYLKAKSNLFTRELVQTETDTFTQYSTQRANINAFYLQLDKSFLDEKLNLTFGTRAESYKIADDSPKVLPVFRGGVNYAVGERDFLRASYGQGYRIPSLAERYIDEDITSGLGAFPNPDLKIEIGSSSEIGYKRAFGKKDKFKGFFDVALYWMDYQDMTEFQFGIHRPDSITGDTTFNDYLNYLGFKATNVSRARIAGFELSAFGEGNLGKYPLRFWAGYTYSYPGDLTQNPDQKNVGVYIKNLFKAFAISPTDPFVPNNILNFRSLHIGRFDAEIDVNQFTFGAAINYHGFMYDVDDLFKGEGEIAGALALANELIGGIVESLAAFRNDHINGDWIVDLRASYSFKDKNKIDIMVNNAFNREYAIRPLKMSPPLTFNLRFSRKF